MVNVATMSGWGQKHDALAGISPVGSAHLDYSKFSGIRRFFESLKGLEVDVLIGWSLGGQLALRAVSEGILKPKVIILLATPYQFVADKDVKCAMDRERFGAFYDGFQTDPVRTIKKFSTLVSLNDKNRRKVFTRLQHTASVMHARKLLFWLQELENFSCHAIDFTKIPETIAVYGRNDTLVDIAQTALFQGLIKEYRLEIFEECGHAPHLHDELLVRKIIQSAL